MNKLSMLFGPKVRAATIASTMLAGCSGGGCGSCIVPPYHASDPTPTPIVTLAPGATPSPSPSPGASLAPGVTPSPTVSPTVPTPTPSPVAPTPTPTPTLVPILPTPTPTPMPTPFLSCNQGGATIPLGNALAPFALLAGSTVTNVGNTIVSAATGATTNGINDDLIGVSPGTAVTGFYPPGVNADGTNAIYAAGYNPNGTVPANAQNALITAYNTVAGRPASATFPGGTDLSITQVPGSLNPPGTFGPGVYKSATTFAINSANLTLDGGGNPQSVFIFQMGTSLTTGANGTIAGDIKLQNGASACNVYWQVGSSATLGGATFYGNVLANQAVTINASTFTGRALAENAAVSIPVAGGSLITNPGGK